MKKVLIPIFLAFVLLSSSVGTAEAAQLTPSQISAIIGLLSSFGADEGTIASVNSALTGTGTSVGTAWCHTFNTNLGIGDSGVEIQSLQLALEREGLYSMGTGIPQQIKESVFDEELAAAVTGFQEKYKDEILTPLGLRYGTGYVGKSTRAKLNQLYGCGVTPPVSAGRLEIQPSTASIAVGGSVSMQAIFNPPMPKCPEGAYCAQVMPAPIPVVAEWTSSNPSVASVLVKEINCTSGACPISVKGNSNGTADIKASYRPSYGDGREIMMAAITATARVTVGSGPSVSSITVLSPNGGEQWQVGQTYEVRWKQSQNSIVSVGLRNLQLPGGGGSGDSLWYRIIILGEFSGKAGENVIRWTIPSGIPSAKGYEVEIGGYFSSGADRPALYQDSSDSPFSIVAAGTGFTNTAPKIIGIPAVLSDIKVGQSVSFSLSAIDADGDNLSWGVSWGDGAGLAGACQSPNSQNKEGWTFKTSHAWQKGGTYTVKATVNDCRGGSNEHTFNVMVGSIVMPSITVLSPNGGEVWAKGTTQTIKWQDNTPVPFCPVGATCAVQAPKYFDIKLIHYYPPCAGNICPRYAVAGPYTIAKSVSGFSYNWSVGKYLDVLGTGTGDVAPDGSYTVQVCQTGTSICDSSDSYFKIVTGGTTTNSSPVINLFPAIPSNIKVGQSVSFSWGATDADGDNLSWGVSWGDGIGVAGACQSPNPQNKQGWTFNTSHAWASPGTYTVKATVNDCRGGSYDNVFNVTVGSIVMPSITVLSPNGGEKWVMGENQTVKWTGSNGTRVNITLLNIDKTKEVYGLAESIINDGNELIKVPYDLPAGQYYLRVSCVENCSPEASFDDSNAPFNIVAATIQSPITVFSPNGGEVLQKATPVAIKWNYDGNYGERSVRIDLVDANPSYGGAPNPVLLIANYIPINSNNYGPTNSGSYTWTIPTTVLTGSNYKIRAMISGNEGYIDESDAPFTISTTPGNAADASSGGGSSFAALLFSLERQLEELERLLNSLLP